MLFRSRIFSRLKELAADQHHEELLVIEPATGLRISHRCLLKKVMNK